ncbi:hypothetical protein Salat_2892700 [Sesamum alatum]|uniref:Uncharacterized protein n=1 Tax=Sesamum alatum TaxID=300844 RepID=A0AAE1XJ77_9LAMI|nr:hypothetical protein Salat_2892700 [Sesamum alatum]
MGVDHPLVVQGGLIGDRKSQQPRSKCTDEYETSRLSTPSALGSHFLWAQSGSSPYQREAALRTATVGGKKRGRGGEKDDLGATEGSGLGGRRRGLAVKGNEDGGEVAIAQGGQAPRQNTAQVERPGCAEPTGVVHRGPPQLEAGRTWARVEPSSRQCLELVRPTASSWCARAAPNSKCLELGSRHLHFELGWSAPADMGAGRAQLEAVPRAGAPGLRLARGLEAVPRARVIRRGLPQLEAPAPRVGGSPGRGSASSWGGPLQLPWARAELSSGQCLELVRLGRGHGARSRRGHGEDIASAGFEPKSKG